MQPIENLLGSFYFAWTKTLLSSLPLRRGARDLHISLSLSPETCARHFICNTLNISSSSLTLSSCYFCNLEQRLKPSSTVTDKSCGSSRVTSPPHCPTAHITTIHVLLHLINTHHHVHPSIANQPSHHHLSPKQPYIHPSFPPLIHQDQHTHPSPKTTIHPSSVPPPPFINTNTHIHHPGPNSRAPG
jgi:hypothetical protein